MKKLSLLIIFNIIAYIATAQEPFKNNEGLIITPEKGEMSMGFDAVPFLKFVGNLIHSDNDSPNSNFTAQNPLTITSNYMLKDNVAFRSKIRLGLGVVKTDTLVARIGSTNPNETVSNETKVNTSNITLGGGLQKWRGKGRVRGFYGGEILFSIGTEKTTFTYGNPMSSENQSTRTKSITPGNTFNFHLKGFIGVEYFFAAKSSLSAEFGWGPQLQTRSRSKVETESWNGVNATSETQEGGKSSSFIFDNDNAGGSLNLNFYF
ncbi:MAG: hypothetical protein IPO63_14765 [Bacteroidetes bacterium]|nr:hypothetical protein [Bacteroidota bacterium]